MEQPKGKGLLIGAGVLAALGVLWIAIMGKALLGVLFILAGAAVYVRHQAAGLPPGATPFWKQGSVLAAGFFGLIAALVLVTFIGEVGRQHENVTRDEAEIAEIQQTLESTQYDAKGNVVGSSTKWHSAMARSKYMPASLKQARSNFYTAIAVTLGATAVFAGCLFVVLRAARKSRAAVPTAG